MEKEELIKLIETLYECFDIEKCEYRGKDVKGKNKYKIFYVEKGYDFILINKTIIEN